MSGSDILVVYGVVVYNPPILYFVVNLAGYFAQELPLLVLGQAVAGRHCGEGGGAGDVQVEGPELFLGGAGGQQLGQYGAHPS